MTTVIEADAAVLASQKALAARLRYCGEQREKVILAAQKRRNDRLKRWSRYFGSWLLRFSWDYATASNECLRSWDFIWTMPDSSAYMRLAFNVSVLQKASTTGVITLGPGEAAMLAPYLEETGSPEGH